MQISGPSNEYMHDHVCMPIDDDVLSSVSRRGTTGSTWSSMTGLSGSVEAVRGAEETVGESVEHEMLDIAGRTILDSPS